MKLTITLKNGYKVIYYTSEQYIQHLLSHYKDDMLIYKIDEIGGELYGQKINKNM